MSFRSLESRMSNGRQVAIDCDEGLVVPNKQAPARKAWADLTPEERLADIRKTEKMIIRIREELSKVKY